VGVKSILPIRRVTPKTEKATRPSGMILGMSPASEQVRIGLMMVAPPGSIPQLRRSLANVSPLGRVFCCIEIPSP